MTYSEKEGLELGGGAFALFACSDKLMVGILKVMQRYLSEISTKQSCGFSLKIYFILWYCGIFIFNR